MSNRERIRSIVYCFCPEQTRHLGRSDQLDNIVLSVRMVHPQMNVFSDGFTLDLELKFYKTKQKIQLRIYGGPLTHIYISPAMATSN
jgi:hypothetical protein